MASSRQVSPVCPSGAWRQGWSCLGWPEDGDVGEGMRRFLELVLCVAALSAGVDARTEQWLEPGAELIAATKGIQRIKRGDRLGRAGWWQAGLCAARFQQFARAQISNSKADRTAQFCAIDQRV